MTNTTTVAAEMASEIERRQALVMNIDRLLASEHLSTDLRTALEADKAHQQRMLAIYAQC